MSWDIIIQNLPLGIRSFEDVPNDFSPPPLGARHAVIARIQEALPAADFSDPTWGIFEGLGFSFEFSMGSNEVCDGFTIHVRGGGDAVNTISHLLAQMKLQAFDCQTGDLFSPDASETSFREWQAYRDRAIHPRESNGS